MKNKQEVYEKLVETSRNYDYTIESLLYYFYHEKYYKLIGIDLSRKASASIPQESNFIEKLEEDNVAKMFFYCQKTEENYFKFSFRLIKCNKIIETMEHKKILN